MSIKTIIIILAFLTSIGMIWQIVLPVYSEVKERQETLNSKKIELQKLQEVINKMNELVGVYKEKETEIEKIWQILPKESDITGLLVQFESLSAQSGLFLSSINFSEVGQQQETAGLPEETQPQLPYKTLSISIKITGSYDAFKNFLSNLENELRLVDVQSISFAPKGEINDIFDFSLTGNVYYQ